VSPTTVADLVVDGLQRAGTPRIFGVPGRGAQLPLVEAARRCGLSVVLAHDEAAACVMAAVTGDLVGAPGAALAAPGPGVAAAATGVARAILDRSPMILVTDRHPGSVHGCKASLFVDAASAAHWTAHAARLAMTEPRGPVHLDVPAAVAGAPAVPLATASRLEPLPPPDPRELDEAARLLAGASRPVLIAGLQCRSSSDAQWLRALAEALPAPVLVTLRAKGILPDPHPLMLGALTAGGAAAELLGRADLIVALGLCAVEASPGLWMTTAPLLHVAPSEATGEWHRPVVPVVGEIALAIEELAPRLRGRARADWDVAELDRLKRALRPREGGSAGRPGPERVARLTREATAAGTIAALDAGPHAAAVAASWDAVAPGEFLASYGPATAGFALPAAIAAHLVHPERRVVCFTGGEGFLAALSELPTATRLRAPIVVVALADGSVDAPELVRVGQRFAVPSAAADSEASFAQALGKALRTDGPTLIAAWP
jgi:acetolactate synthase I/II/III large subunit